MDIEDIAGDNLITYARNGCTVMHGVMPCGVFSLFHTP
jgi:hypothetical protein